MNGISALLWSCGLIPNITQVLRSRNGILYLMRITLFISAVKHIVQEELAQYIIFIRRRKRKGKACKPIFYAFECV